MQIHLIKTPDYPLESFKEVIDILRTFPGPISFVSSQHEFQKEDFYFLTRAMRSRGNDDFDRLKKQFYIAQMGMPLSWKELFSLCGYYRNAVDVPQSDFVILLTERTNTMNWFSMFDPERNAFVHCGDWELFTDAPSQYPIAYEVMANLLRCLMKPDFENPKEWFHDYPVGCMNDLCQQKSDIILKLKTADICNKCQQKMLDAHVPDQVLEQAFRVFEGMRKQLLFRGSLKRNIEPSLIKLTEQRRLLFPELGNLELRLNPLEMTLYVFYLINPAGVMLTELYEHRVSLLSIYRKFAVHDIPELIDSRITNLVDPFSNSFSEKKSALNRKIKTLLGDELGSHYTINGEPGSAFRISLAAELIQIQEGF